MELVVIGTYEEESPAHGAKHELLASGFSRSSVQLNPDHDLSGAHPAKKDRGSTLPDKIGGLFGELFRMENKSTYSNVYADAVRRGNFVLTVEVDSDEQRAKAKEIMTRHGQVDIEERSPEWVWQGWRGHDPKAR